MRDDERLIYELVTEMNETRTLSQPTYDRALAALGLDTTIELDHRARLLHDGRDHAERLRRAGAGRRAAAAVNGGQILPSSPIASKNTAFGSPFCGGTL